MHVGTQCLGEGWSWLAKSHPLGTGGVSTQLSHSWVGGVAGRSML